MKNQKGFTLVELIVVIAILGILGAIAVPKFGGFKETAAKKADEATMDVIRNTVLIALANGDITVTGEEGTITIDTTEDPITFEGSNITTSDNNDLEKVMTDLLDTKLKAQVTNRIGFTVTIKSNGDIKVDPKK
ncbi:type II secretion system GspH family protein [Alkaliphilus sp. MSJ-5]|uniref:Type II secretion system GspH family protein n=2 Tax=Alkaliphilus flagellatus TaxID=2841507 RepID=A0ABS6G639_9FIRM|nr:type II secretion system GspH family protein [Alkaliphilus flagellatus]